ncbi:MAG: hypothetical protein H7124_00070 [Phycisphaerales bacterium]|nr:hypothetical protein [Hyphomonadaceae bacterium]
MEINWSAFDGILGIVLIIILIWVGLKLMTRLLIGVIAVVVIGVVFFGWHLGGFAGG